MVSALKSKYQTIFWDADETLFDFLTAEKEALQVAFRTGGLNFNRLIYERYREINEALWRELELGLISKDRLQAIRFQRLFAEYSIDFDGVRMNRLYLDQLARNGQVFPEAVTLLRQIPSDYRHYLATNGIAYVQHGRLAASPIRDFFSGVIVSEEVGAAKPHKRFFEQAIRIAQADVANSLMIGDSLSSDIAGASAYGLDCCWLNRRGAVAPDDLRITYEVANLSEILTIL